MKNSSNKQVSKTATILLSDEINKVFPLFSPMEERKWVESWNPEFIYPANGNWVENMVFRTKAGNASEKIYNWVLTYFNPKAYQAVYTVFTENRVWTIKVQCTPHEENETKAEITYTFTAFNEKGYSLNIDAIEKMYRNELKDWEETVNYFLKNKEKSEL
jgi:hypothetical protein